MSTADGVSAQIVSVNLLDPFHHPNNPDRGVILGLLKTVSCPPPEVLLTESMYAKSLQLTKKAIHLRYVEIFELAFNHCTQYATQISLWFS